MQLGGCIGRFSIGDREARKRQPSRHEPFVELQRRGERLLCRGGVALAGFFSRL
jgi:hypothetical protein